MSSEGKDTNVSENEKEKGKKNAKKAKAVDFSKFVAKAEVWDKGVPLRSQMLGIYHAPSGFAVASDGHILVYDKRQYDGNRKGQIVALKDIKKGSTRREGTQELWWFYRRKDTDAGSQHSKGS